MAETLGRYRLLSLLGSSSVAEVWLAEGAGESDSSGARFAVKKILAFASNDDDFGRVFLEEARLTARLHHPNIVAVVGFGEDRGTYYLAMEYVAGRNLEMLRREAEQAHAPLPFPLAARLVLEVAQGLSYAHAARDDRGEPLHLVHGEISPRNILVSDDGAVKLADFGLAKAKAQLDSTGAGGRVARHAYLSPEQVLGRPTDQRTDLFALGIVAFELFTGRPLFWRDTQTETRLAVQDCAVPAPSSIARHLPADLDAIVLKALAKAPEERYPDVDTFAAALAWLLRRRGSSPEPSLGGEPALSLRSHLRTLPPRELGSAEPKTRKTPQRSAPREDPFRALATRGPIRDPRKPRRPEDDRPPVAVKREWQRSPKPTASPPSSPPPDSTVNPSALTEDAEARPRFRWLRWLLRTTLLLGLLAFGLTQLPDLRAAFEKSFGSFPGLAGDGSSDGTPRGRLSLETTPTVRVFLGKRDLGDTPLVELALPAGRHQLRLVSEPLAIDALLSVDVVEGTTTDRHEVLPTGTVHLDVPPGHAYRVLFRGRDVGRLPGPDFVMGVGRHELTLVDIADQHVETRSVVVTAPQVLP